MTDQQLAYVVLIDQALHQLSGVCHLGFFNNTIVFRLVRLQPRVVHVDVFIW